MQGMARAGARWEGIAVDSMTEKGEGQHRVAGLGERARVIAGKRFLMGSAVDETDRLLRHQLV